VPSFRRRESVIEADPVDKSTAEPDLGSDAGQALALAEEAEAEAAEAEAMAAAARARARALRLRREAEAAGEQSADLDSEAADVETNASEIETQSAEEPASDVVILDDDAEIAAADDTETAPARSRWRRVPRPKWRWVAAAVVVLLTLGLLGVSGYMIKVHRDAQKMQQLNAEYSAAGRQSVVTLMSLDFNTAEEGVQRIIDNSTGQFKTDFEAQAKDFVQVAQDSKVITEVSVNSTAVQSMTGDSAVVLVAASSRVTNSAGANQEPRTWRLSVDLKREGDQIKMAKVEFVP
jgi:Mce-associated membrane protein